MKLLNLESQIKNDSVLHKTCLKIYTYLYTSFMIHHTKTNAATYNSTEMFRGLYYVSLHQGISLSKEKKKK